MSRELAWKSDEAQHFRQHHKQKCGDNRPVSRAKSAEDNDGKREDRFGYDVIRRAYIGEGGGEKRSRISSDEGCDDENKYFVVRGRVSEHRRRVCANTRERRLRNGHKPCFTNEKIERHRLHCIYRDQNYRVNKILHII